MIRIFTHTGYNMDALYAAGLATQVTEAQFAARLSPTPPQQQQQPPFQQPIPPPAQQGLNGLIQQFMPLLPILLQKGGKKSAGKDSEDDTATRTSGSEQWRHPQSSKTKTSARTGRTESRAASKTTSGQRAEVMRLTKGPAAFDAKTRKWSSPKYQQYYQWMKKYAAKYKVPLALVLAQAERESGLGRNIGDPNGLNNGIRDGYGIMQIKKDTANMMGIAGDSYKDPEKNIEAGVAFMRWLANRYTGPDGKVNWNAVNVGYGGYANITAEKTKNFTQFRPDRQAYLSELREYARYYKDLLDRKILT